MVSSMSIIDRENLSQTSRNRCLRVLHKIPLFNSSSIMPLDVIFSPNYWEPDSLPANDGSLIIKPDTAFLKSIENTFVNVNLPQTKAFLAKGMQHKVLTIAKNNSNNFHYLVGYSLRGFPKVTHFCKR